VLSRRNDTCRFKETFHIFFQKRLGDFGDDTGASNWAIVRNINRTRNFRYWSEDGFFPEVGDQASEKAITNYVCNRLSKRYGAFAQQKRRDFIGWSDARRMRKSFKFIKDCCIGDEHQ
jgi:hypothetical protein